MPDRLGAFTRVLDIGYGVGGPACYLAATFGRKVTGVASAGLH